MIGYNACMTQSERSLESCFYQALQQWQQGDPVAACQTLEQLLAHWPDCKEAWYQLGEFCQQQGELIQAVEHYTRVLELDPTIQEVYNNLGVIARLNGQFEMARAYFEQALAINPDFAPAHTHLGQLLISLEPEQARHHFQMALQTEPELASPLLQQALYDLQQGHDQPAMLILNLLVAQAGPVGLAARAAQAFARRHDPQQVALWREIQLSSVLEPVLVRLEQCGAHPQLLAFVGTPS